MTLKNRRVVVLGLGITGLSAARWATRQGARVSVADTRTDPPCAPQLRAELPQIELIPTGGVSLKTAADFIRAGASALGVGADLVDLKALDEGQAELITERARQFVEVVREARR